MIEQIVNKFKELPLYWKFFAIFDVVVGTFIVYVLYQIIFNNV